MRAGMMAITDMRLRAWAMRHEITMQGHDRTADWPGRAHLDGIASMVPWMHVHRHGHARITRACAHQDWVGKRTIPCISPHAN